MNASITPSSLHEDVRLGTHTGTALNPFSPHAHVRPGTPTCPHAHVPARPRATERSLIC